MLSKDATENARNEIATNLDKIILLVTRFEMFLNQNEILSKSSQRNLGCFFRVVLFITD